MNRLLLEHKKSYDNINICCCYENNHDAFMPVFYFYRHLYLQTWGHIYRYRLPLEVKRGLSLGQLIRSFCIMLLYRYLLHYVLLLHVMLQYLCLFSLILQGFHEEGECRQLEFWGGKGANIRDLFCTTPEVLKLHGSTF